MHTGQWQARLGVENDGNTKGQREGIHSGAQLFSRLSVVVVTRTYECIKSPRNVPTHSHIHTILYVNFLIQKKKNSLHKELP